MLVGGRGDSAADELHAGELHARELYIVQDGWPRDVHGIRESFVNPHENILRRGM